MTDTDRELSETQMRERLPGLTAKMELVVLGDVTYKREGKVWRRLEGR